MERTKIKKKEAEFVHNNQKFLNELEGNFFFIKVTQENGNFWTFSSVQNSSILILPATKFQKISENLAEYDNFLEKFGLF